MRLSMLEFMILLDALSVSTRIADNAGLFRYTEKTRKDVWVTLHERMRDAELSDVADGEPAPTVPAP